MPILADMNKANVSIAMPTIHHMKSMAGSTSSSDTVPCFFVDDTVRPDAIVQTAMPIDIMLTDKYLIFV